MSSSQEIRFSDDLYSEIQSQLAEVTDQLSDYGQDIQSLARTFYTTRRSMDLNISQSIRLSTGARLSARWISSALEEIGTSIKDCSRRSQQLRRQVIDTRERFLQAEREIAAKLQDDKDISSSGRDHGGGGRPFPESSPGKRPHGGEGRPLPDDSGFDWNWGDLFKNLINSAGNVGKTGQIFVDWFQNKNPWKTGALTLATMAEWFEPVVKSMSKKGGLKRYLKKGLLKDAFGLTTFAKEMGFRPSVIKDAGKRFFRNLTKSGAFIKEMKNPANWIFEAIDKGFENLNEYQKGYKKAGTAVAEWATETAVSVAAGAGSVALIGAAIPGAPVIAVAALGGLAIWGVDTLWANTIGKGKDEDGGNEGLIESIGEGIVGAGEFVVTKAADGFKKAGGIIADGWNILTGWI